MTTWFTSDLHLGHANIIRYCDRPWPDVAAMNAGLVERWNDAVADDDTVWVLGDLAMGPIDASLALVASLHGRKLLLAGNHDRCWAGHGDRSLPWVDRYLAAGFAEIHQGEIGLTVGGHDVIACHFPYRGDSHDDERFVGDRPVDCGDWLLHGHVHERWRQDGRMLNVGVDVWDYRPVSEERLASLVAAG